MAQKIALTDISVRAIKAPARGQTTVWDKLSPVGVRVSQGGAKTFIVMVGSGQRRVIGRFGILTLAEARTEAKRVLAQKTLGLIAKPSTITFESALSQFLEENYKDKKPRTKHEAKRLLESHFLPAFRKMAIVDITDHDINNQLAKLKHVPSEQLHAFRVLRTMFRWCTRPPRRYIPHSPLEGYEVPGRDRKGKVLAYNTIADDHIYRSHLGLKNLLVLSVIPDQRRMKHIMQLVTRHQAMYLFQSIPPLGPFQNPPPPMLRLFTEPWQRVAGSFDLSTIERR